jgi:hypothetical protein
MIRMRVADARRTRSELTTIAARMTVHDWTRVDPGIFHAFHTSWMSELMRALNSGILPSPYYALAEQVAGEASPDVLTLRAQPTSSAPAGSEGTWAAVAEAPPHVSVTDEFADIDLYAARQRTLVIRHRSGDDVALLEIVSHGNKSSRPALDRFVRKVISSMTSGYHVLVVDLWPPGPLDPGGIHGAIWAAFGREIERLGKPLTRAAYAAGTGVKAYVEPVAVNERLPDMPLFLTPTHYVRVPLEATYATAWQSIPARWRDVVAGP